MPGTYLLTFRTYGTWLPGDDRTWTDRRNNLHGEKKSEPQRGLHGHHNTKLSQKPFTLSREQRKQSLACIMEFCDDQEFKLHAANILKQHVHLVVSAPIDKEILLKRIKAAITKSLKYSNLVSKERKVWARHGSTVPLFTQDEYHRAIDYTLNQQESQEFIFDGAKAAEG